MVNRSQSPDALNETALEADIAATATVADRMIEVPFTRLVAHLVNGDTFECSNPAAWHPTMHTRQDHHHPPLAWRRELLEADPDIDQSWWIIVPLCGLCHDEYHTLLNLYVWFDRHEIRVPPRAMRRTFSVYVQALVALAWKHRPPRPIPYT